MRKKVFIFILLACTLGTIQAQTHTSGELKELKQELADDFSDSTPTQPNRPNSPTFKVPDTTFAIGWIPTRTRHLVNDYTGILTPQQERSLEQRLVALDNSNSVQIMILITPDLGGNEIADFTQNVWEQWGVGDKKANNGIIIVVKPKNSTDGQVRIQTGYGMEGALPDAFCKDIIDKEMIAHFKNNDYYGGIVAALDVIEPVCKGEFSYAQRQKEEAKAKWVRLALLLGGMIALVVFLRIMAKKGGGTGNNSGTGSSGGTHSGPIFWGGGLGGFGGGYSGGNFGGGFGGFGGGSSGGGGASGRW